MGSVNNELKPITSIVFLQILKYHILMAWNNKAKVLHSILFFIVAIIAFRIAVGFENIANSVLIAVVTISLLFSLVLSCETLIINDYQQGFLEQYLLTGVELELIILAKWLAHVIISVISFIIILPPVFYLLSSQLGCSITSVLAIFLMIANVVLVLLFCSALILGYNKNLLLSIISLLFNLPAIILTNICINGNPVYLWILFALLLFNLPIFIISCTMAIRIAIAYD